MGCPSLLSPSSHSIIVAMAINRALDLSNQGGIAYPRVLIMVEAYIINLLSNDVYQHMLLYYLLSKLMMLFLVYLEVYISLLKHTCSVCALKFWAIV